MSRKRDYYIEYKKVLEFKFFIFPKYTTYFCIIEKVSTLTGDSVFYSHKTKTIDKFIIEDDAILELKYYKRYNC